MYNIAGFLYDIVLHAAGMHMLEWQGGDSTRVEGEKTDLEAGWQAGG